jgi:type IX secretion system PorP/SprF family membrane protein
MKKVVKQILFIVTLFMVNEVIGQDPNFSQFFASPLTINPAYTGFSDYHWRANTNFRNQNIGLGTTYDTKTISIDGRIYNNELKQSYLAVGGMFLLDEAMSGIYKSNNVSINAAYHVTLGGDDERKHGLTVGLGGIYNKTNIDYASLTNSQQLSPIGFNRQLPAGETFIQDIPAKSSATAGIMYSYISEKQVLDVGFAGYRFYNNNFSVFANGTQLTTPRYDFHLNYSNFINYNLILFLKTYYQTQNGINNLIGGGHVEYFLTGNYEALQRSVDLGVYYRYNDAVIPYIGIANNQLKLAFSYDIQVSKMKAAAIIPTSYEISLTYRRLKNKWNPLLQ